MQTLAHWDGGPGPWILFLPLIWAAVVIGVVTVLRRTVWRGRRGPWRGPDRPRPSGDSPIALLGRRFAAGEIDEDEYWRRLSVLDEQFGHTLADERFGRTGADELFGRTGKGGAA
ncbi:SHOCT domain-containing protein [Streptomyces sp. SD11]|uniref:SHOCT domain-containing protein n=1 Tax=Streptomyces sp. SD11 TaxID=3452209 RepID=UPI003F88A775